MYVQRAQRVPKEVNPKRSTPRHATIRMSKIKERLIRVAKERNYLHIREHQ